jgi:secreted trypsin-like serine protease
MSNPRLAACLLLTALGCAGADPNSLDLATQDDEIVGGKPDKGRDPAVIAIDIDGQGLCSGTVVAPRVVLTARHCVSDTVEEIDCRSGGRQIYGDRDPSSLTIVAGDTFRTGTPIARGKKLVVPSSTTLCGKDIALIELDRAVSITPLKVNVDHPLRVGDKVKMVGYGQRGDDAAAGRKYMRENVPILELSKSELLVGEVSCSGDSGGPAIDKGRSAVVGVVSRGGPVCEGSEARNVYTRTDAFASLVKQAIDETRK